MLSESFITSKPTCKKYLMGVDVTKSIYESRVLPALTYCGLQLLCVTTTQEEKLATLTNSDVQRNSTRQLRKNKKRASELVKSCVDGEVVVVDLFIEYFAMSSHQKNTCNNAKMIILLKTKTEY